MQSQHAGGARLTDPGDFLTDGKRLVEVIGVDENDNIVIEDAKANVGKGRQTVHPSELKDYMSPESWKKKHAEESELEEAVNRAA